MIEIILKLWSLLTYRARVQAILLLLPITCAAALEMIGIAAVVPLVGAIVQDSNSRLVQTAMSIMPEGVSLADLLLVLAGTFALLQLLKNLAILSIIFAVNRFIQGLISSMIERLFSLYLYRPYVSQRSVNSAVAVRNIFSTTSQAFDGVRVTLNLCLEAILGLSACVVLLLIEPAITLAMVGVLGSLAGMFYYLTASRFGRWGAIVHQHEAQLIKTIREGIGGIKDIKVLNCQPVMVAELGRHAREWAHTIASIQTAHNMPRLFGETLVIFTIFGIVVFLVSANEPIERLVATLGLFGMAALRLLPSLNRVLANMAILKEKAQIIATLADELAEEMPPPPPTIRSMSLPPNGKIVFSNITFSYQPCLPILHGISTEIRHGQSLGIVGPTGSGKTTLMDIVLGLVPPEGGKLLVDGVDVLVNPRAWQARVGYVSQHIFLADTSLRRNVAFGVAEDEIDDERVAAALALANLTDLVASLPDGTETRLGEDGVRFSGGQRQLVGIARALYRDPAVLMFDEATSSLDNETERVITDAINGLRGKKTLIVIAHRLSTVKTCDRILFMRRGCVIDTGQFDELLARNADFRRFASAVEAASVH